MWNHVVHVKNFTQRPLVWQISQNGNIGMIVFFFILCSSVFALKFLMGMHYFSFRRKLNKEMVDFEIWIWLTKKNHDSSYARVKIFGNYLMKSPNKPKNFFFHEIHGWPAFAYLDWPKWLQNCPFDEWWSHQVLESLI